MRLFKQISYCAGLLLLISACDNASTSIEKKVENTMQTIQTKTDIVMYKSPTCECCTGWAKHLRANGYSVTENKREDMEAIKTKYGVPDPLKSCHTALIGGYIIEGHVPASDIARLLKERPDIVGLTAPGMPMKSPGMQDVGQKPHGYDVLAFSKDGTSTVFSHY